MMAQHLTHLALPEPLAQPFWHNPVHPHVINERLLLIALLLVTANLRPALASLGPVLESLRTDLQLSHTAVGILNSVPIICMGVCAPLALWLQRRFGLRSGILGMTMLLTAGIAVRLHASISMQFASALLLGISIAALGPLLAGFTKQHFVNSARVSAWSTTAFCLSASLGATVSAWLTTHWPWPATLAIFSVPVGITAILWWFVAPADAPAQTSVDHRPPPASPWHQWRGWMLLVCFGTNTLVFFALLAWLPALFTDLRVSAATAGYLLGWFTLLQIIAPLVIGMIAKPQQDRRMLLWLSGLCLLTGLMGLLLLPLTFTLAFTLGWLALAGLGTSGLFTLTMMLALDFSEDARSSASWMAMISTGGYLIAALGPWLFGALREYTGNYAASLQLLIVATGVALLSCHWLAPIRLASASNPR